MPIEVHHFAPDISRVGGIETVVTILVRDHVGADLAIYHRTRARGTPRDTLLTLATSTREIFRLLPRVVVHAHLSQGGSFIREGWVLVLARARGIATVATIHGSRFVGFARAHPKLVKVVLAQADAITCLSEEAREEILKLLPKAPITIVPNPVPSDTASSPAGETAEVVLFAGEIGERKGVDILCRAWSIVAARRPVAQCTIVGPRTQLDIPPLDRLRIVPPRSTAEVAALIRTARVVVLPSRNEGMPMILTEALAAGRPFVSTPVGGIPQLANGTQPLVPVGDHTALADRITEILASPALAERLGEAGRAFHAETRSTEVIGEILRTTYCSALAKQRKPLWRRLRRDATSRGLSD
jgi:glycosyltransferase involved in cell wall biosynthesis